VLSQVPNEFHELPWVSSLLVVEEAVADDEWECGQQGDSVSGLQVLSHDGDALENEEYVESDEQAVDVVEEQVSWETGVEEQEYFWDGLLVVSSYSCPSVYSSVQWEQAFRKV
jgi:hypothetical protein